MKKIIVGQNDFKTWCKQNGKEYLLAEWDFEKNTLYPDQVSKGSHINVWWKCSNGHEWQANIKNRTSGTNCPSCSRTSAARSRNTTLLNHAKSLAICYPELVREWHPTKNANITPENVLPNSNKRVWWLCKNGHEWESTISNRTKGSGCPFCSGRNAVSGKNDLATLHPEIAKEWHPAKNGTLTPKDFTCGSSKRIWWQCSKGHEWQTPIVYRITDKTGCPYCSQELRTSFPEQAIYYYVKKCFPDAINNDRTVLEGKELDIYIPSSNIAIEYDGQAWHTNKTRDLYKDELCLSKGIRLIRIRESGCQSIEHKADIYNVKAGDRTSLSVIIRDICNNIANKIIDVDVERDSLEIQNQYVVSSKNLSLAEMHPEIAKEWHPTLNGCLNPTMFFSGSGKKVWWKCPKGHDYQSIIEARVDGRGCPYCSGRSAIAGENDLETINPLLAKEWHPTKNGLLKPSDVLPKSSKKVWWKCSKCGYEWEAIIKARKKPYCNSCNRKDAISKISKPVICVETNQEYKSASEAERITKIKHISSTCNGKRKTAGGYHWKYK